MQKEEKIIFLKSINNFANEILSKISPNKASYQELTSASLYHRCHSFFKTTVLTISEGYSASAKVLLRSSIESMFWLVAISYDELWGEKYVLQDQLVRKKFYNKSKLIADEDLKIEILKLFPKEFVDNITKQIKEKDIKQISIQDVARAAKKIDWYHTAYSDLSSAIHSSVRELENIISYDNNTDSIVLKLELDFTDFNVISMTASETIFHSLLAVERIFNIPTAKFVKDSMDSMDILFPES